MASHLPTPTYTVTHRTSLPPPPPPPPVRCRSRRILSPNPRIAPLAAAVVTTSLVDAVIDAARMIRFAMQRTWTWQVRGSRGDEIVLSGIKRRQMVRFVSGQTQTMKECEWQSFRPGL